MVKKHIVAGLAAVALLLSGCGKETEDNSKIKLTVSLSRADLLEDFAPYLQEAVPEADIEFLVGRDIIDYYVFKKENGDLPDILLMGNLSMRDSAALNGYLLDISGTETALSFYDTYLDTYREPDGSVKWLPASSIANGILANTDLFDKYGIALPTDYDSFAAACAAFEEVGIIPYISDFKYDYTCLYTLEGMNISTLMTPEGMAWRRNYANGLTDSMDADLWKTVFSQYKTFIDDTGVGADVIEWGYTMTFEAFRDGNVAMVRGMSNELPQFSEYHGSVLLPYFGSSEEDNWLLTTPIFYTALNGELDGEKNEKKREVALKVLDAMYSQEGYDAVTETFGYTLPYKRGVNAAITSDFENLSPVVDSTHMSILMTSEALLSSSKEAVQRLLRGELNSDEAYEAMNAALTDPEKSEPEMIITLENAYPVSFDKKKGNQAGSSIANTMRKISGSDVLITPSTISTGSMYACGYSYEMADAMFQPSGNRIFTKELSGAEIREIVRLAVEGYDSLNDPFSDQTLPIVSGFTITVEKTEEGYRLADISLSDEETYSFAIVDNPLHCRSLIDTVLGEGALSDQFVQSDDQGHIIWANYLSEGNQPEAPTEYITLKIILS